MTRSSATTVDIAVVGLGAMGSATVHALARRGARVLGIDQFQPPHSLGSSHGRSRIIREAYYESPLYVPLVQRAYQLWQRIAQDSGNQLLRQTGGLMLGPAESTLITGALASARQHGLAHELLDAAQLQRRFPIFAVADPVIGLFEPRAGVLDPELSVASCLTLAARDGAALWFHSRVSSWQRTGDGIQLETDRGAVECGQVVLAAGPWLGELLPGSWPLTVERQVMYWFLPRRERSRFSAERCPIFMWEWQPKRLFYGIPDHGFGLKVAAHHEGMITTPADVDRQVHVGEEHAMRDLLRRHLPDADGALLETAVCLYTDTPDQHFVLGAHPQEPRVILASPCSGHGFKFASAIGEQLAELVLDGKTSLDISLFAPERLVHR